MEEVTEQPLVSDPVTHTTTTLIATPNLLTVLPASADAPQLATAARRLSSATVMQALAGERDRHLRWLEQRLHITIHARGCDLRVDGPADGVRTAERVLDNVVARLDRGQPIDSESWRRALERARGPEGHDDVGLRGKLGSTTNQRRYVDAIARHDIVFGVGPAGTGKTYLAVAMAVEALERHDVKRIVLTRPAVEAGERLGFLPGDLVAKVNPYLRPLFDALGDRLDAERVERLIERGSIEIAPLAFMRGRTLSNAFVILDEAQNCSVEQMAMLLTRIGHDSKAVVTGDPMQSDLPRQQQSGLQHALRILDGIAGIGVIEFGFEDVVRHPLVAAIAAAYQRDREPHANG